MAVGVAMALLATAVRCLAAPAAATARHQSSAATTTTAGVRADGAGPELTPGTFTLQLEKKNDFSTAVCPKSLTFSRISPPTNQFFGPPTVAAADARANGTQCAGSSVLMGMSDPMSDDL